MERLCAILFVASLATAEASVKYGLESSNVCPQESVAITDAANCEGLSGVNGLVYYQSGDWSHLPTGCIKGSGAHTITNFNTHPIGKVSSGWVVVCLQASVVYGLLQSNVCPQGSAAIADKATCKAVADANSLNYGYSSSWASVPVGCYNSHGGGHATFFNTHPTGNGSSSQVVVCTKVPAPLPPPAQAAVVYGLVLSNVCPQGSAAIADGATCRALSDANDLNYGYSQSWANEPVGCYKAASGLATYFNTHSTGTMSASNVVVCTKADTPMTDVAKLQAQIDGMKANYDESLDTIWMLLAGMLVFFMHAGFSLLEVGTVRFKNAQNILTKNLLVVSLGFLCWWSFGWTLAYGTVEDPHKFSGGTEFFMDGFWDDKTRFRNWFFQGAFCATGCTIVSGATAERMQLKGFGIIILAMTAFIYPAVAYWGWSGNGFLVYTNDAGESVSSFGPAYMDFAGSGIVHLVGGIGALVGAITVGPRLGRFDPNSEDDFTAHSVPFIVLGTFFLWFGWYGFNPGSTLGMKTTDDAHRAGLVAVNTTLAPCVAGLLVFALRAKVCAPHCLDVGGFCNGILAGLVSITAGCAFVKPWESIIIGFIGGGLYQAASMLLQRLKIDDVVDAFPVHGVGGMWGVLALGFFGDPDQGMGGNGVFYGGDQLRTQVMGIIVIIAWAGGLCLLIMAPLRKLGMLRLDDEIQQMGADEAEHSPVRAFGSTLEAEERRKSQRNSQAQEISAVSKAEDTNETSKAGNDASLGDVKVQIVDDEITSNYTEVSI